MIYQQNQKDIKTLNNPIIDNEIEAIIKNLPTKENPEPDGFSIEFCKNLRKVPSWWV